MVAKEKEVELENLVAAGEIEVAGGVGREGVPRQGTPKTEGGGGGGKGKLFLLEGGRDEFEIVR